MRPLRRAEATREFAWRRKAKGQRHNYCRPCHSAYKREHYLANKQRYVEQAAEHKRKTRFEQTALLVEYFKEHPCVDCGLAEPDRSRVRPST